MPVWGQQFLLSDKRLYGPDDGPVVTQERIHELATFIESLQR
ncbi:cytochrome C [Aminobacter aminovorans]|nr:cytochrome C [Aminobacter aminovorans]